MWSQYFAKKNLYFSLDVVILYKNTGGLVYDLIDGKNFLLAFVVQELAYWSYKTFRVRSSPQSSYFNFSIQIRITCFSQGYSQS